MRNRRVGERILFKLMTSDRALKASRESSKKLLDPKDLTIHKVTEGESLLSLWRRTVNVRRPERGLESALPFAVYGLRFMVHGLWFRVQVYSSWFMVHGLGFRVRVLGVEGLRVKG